VAQGGGVGEYELKAAFLYNFAKFVEWPAAGQQEEFTLCVIGGNPFGAALNPLSSSPVRGRAVVVTRLSDPEEISRCNMLFVDALALDRLPVILQRSRDAHVLTVADIDGFTRRGGMIGLVSEDNRIRFDINTRAANDAGLRVSSRLLSLARRVLGDGTSGTAGAEGVGSGMEGNRP